MKADLRAQAVPLSQPTDYKSSSNSINPNFVRFGMPHQWASLCVSEGLRKRQEN